MGEGSVRNATGEGNARRATLTLDASRPDLSRKRGRGVQLAW